MRLRKRQTAIGEQTAPGGRAEEAVPDLDLRCRLLDFARDVICVIGLDGTRKYLSAAVSEILGYEREDLIGRRQIEISRVPDIERVEELLAALARGEREQAHSIHRARHRNGHEVWLDVQFRLVRDAATGKPSEIVSSLLDVTDRETLRQQAESDQRRLLMAEQIAHVGHWHLDLQTNLLTWSEELYRIHGLDRTAFAPNLHNVLQRYHPEDGAETLRLIEATAANGGTYEAESRVLRDDGTIRHILSRGYPEIDPDTGRVAALVGTVRDRTDAVENDLRLRRETNFLETTLDNIDQGLVEVASDGTILLANRRFIELFGLPGEIFDEARPNFADVLAHLHRTGEIPDPEQAHSDPAWASHGLLALGTHEHHRPNGMILEIRTVRLPNGARVRTYADITISRKAETLMRESETRFRILAEATSDLIIQLDLNLERQYVSPASRTLLGYEPDELIDGKATGRIHPDDEGAYAEVAARLVAGAFERDRAVSTYRMQHKKGHWVWIEAVMNLVRHVVTGSPASVICSLRDVTERQRTARHLENAWAAAEQAARAKAEFVANMSHELRTPLTGMLGVQDLLKRDPTLSDAQRRLVSLASDSSVSLLKIVNDILDFSKIEAGQLTIEATPFDVRGLVEICQVLAGESAKSKPVTLTSSLEPAVPGWLVGDPNRLQQVLLNLLTNAVKFTHHGTIRTDVSYEISSGTLRVAVTDTGIGIPADKVASLFDRFTQADTSTARRYGGTGLGLAISKQLIELMGGRIGVATQPGEGSSFWFELPLQADVGPADTTAPALSGEGPHPRCRILLAEDNLLNQEIITAYLTASGYHLTVVPDGKAAVDAVADGAEFDLVLMDVQMPGMDGFQATAGIRQWERALGRGRLPIIGLTANAMAGDVARCLEAGMDGHVAKPVEWPILFKAIDRATSASLDATVLKQEEPHDVLDLPAFDKLLRIIGGERLGQMLAGFSEDVDRLVQGIEDAPSWVVLARTHVLASSAGQLGFRQILRLCHQIEAEAREGRSLQRAPELHAAIERALAIGRARLDTLAAA